MTTTVDRPPRTLLPGRGDGSSTPGGGRRDRGAASVRAYRRPLLTVAAGACGVALAWWLPTISAASGTAAAALSTLRWGWVPWLVVAEFLSMAMPAVNHQRLLAASGTDVRVQPLLALTFAGNALSTTLPLAGPEAGTAFTYRRLQRYGAEPAAAAWTLLVSGVFASVSFTALAVLGAAGSGSGGASALLLAAAVSVVPVLLLLLLLRRPVLRARFAGVVVAGPGAVRGRAVSPTEAALGARLHGFLVRLGTFRLGRHDMAALAAGSVVNWVADLACLAMAVAAVGASASGRRLSWRTSRASAPAACG